MSAGATEQLDTILVTARRTDRRPILTVESVNVLWQSLNQMQPRAVVSVDGRIAVADATSIHVLTEAGEHRSTIAGDAAGKSLFGRIGGLGVVGRLLLVWDPQRLQVSTLTVDGILVDSWHSDSDTGFRSPQLDSYALHPVLDGFLQAAWPGILPTTDPMEAAVLWRAFRRDDVELLGRWPAGQLIMTPDEGDGRIATWAQPLGARARLAVGPGGRWAYGDGLEYCITIARLNSNTVHRACREWSRVPASASLWQPDWAALRATDMSAGEAAQARRRLAAETSGEQFPSYDRLWFSEAGDLWVRVFDEPRTNVHPDLAEQVPELRPDYYSWDVFSGEGTLLMTVRLPSRFVPYFILRDGAYGLVRTTEGGVAVASVTW